MGEKRKGRHFFWKGSMIGLFIALLLCPAISMAVEFGDGALRLNGYFQNETGVRFKDHALMYAEDGDLSLMRSTFQLDFSGKFSPTVTYGGVYRAWYEGMYDLDDDSIDQRPRDKMLKDGDFREYYLTADFGNLSIQLGKQQLVWGESDLFRMADIVNPLDLSWHYVFPCFQDIRIPLRMAVISYAPRWHDLLVEVVAIPEDFQTAKLAPEGANWFPPAFLMPGLYNHAIYLMERDEPDTTLKNFEGGLRLKGVFGGVDLSLFYFYSRSDTPVMEFGLTNPLPTMLRMKFPFYQAAGGTFTYYNPATKTVFRGETVFNIDNPYTAMITHPLLGVPVPTPVEKDVWAFMLGFDRPTFLGWPKGRTSFISGQIFQKYILNHDDSLIVGDMEDKDKQTILTFTINTTLGQGNKYIPQLLIGYDVSGSGLVQPQLKYTYSDNISATLTANFLWGHDELGGFFSPYKDNDEVWLQLRVSF